MGLVSRASHVSRLSGLSTACHVQRTILGSSRSRRCVEDAWGSGVHITTFTIMDRASQALAEVFSAGDSAPYRAVSEKSSVPRSSRSTPHCHKHGGASILLEAQSEQYLSLDEEKAMVKFLLLMSNFGHPVQIKYIPSLVRHCKGPLTSDFAKRQAALCATLDTFIPFVRVEMSHRLMGGCVQPHRGAKWLPEATRVTVGRAACHRTTTGRPLTMLLGLTVNSLFYFHYLDCRLSYFRVH